jgi:hypothetical protein
MATVCNDHQGVDPDPPHPSARLPCDVLTGIMGGPYTILVYITIGILGYRPTHVSYTIQLSYIQVDTSNHIHNFS